MEEIRCVRRRFPWGGVLQTFDQLCLTNKVTGNTMITERLDHLLHGQLPCSFLHIKGHHAPLISTPLEEVKEQYGREN